MTLADDAEVAWEPTGTCLIGDCTATASLTTPGSVAGDGGTAAGVVTITMADTALDQDDCKGQSVPLHIEIG